MSKPLIVLSYSWLLRNHNDFTDEELGSALYATGAGLVHIQNDENFDARGARAHGGNPQARVRPFIEKAIAEGRFARVRSRPTSTNSSDDSPSRLSAKT